MKIDLRLGDCIEVLKTLEDNSVDSIVTDPPYGLSFMNKKWDYDVPSVEIWKECFRVLKPGGHLLSFGGSRTYHRMAIGLEDAGFEIRDQIMWVFGSGFPKSHNIGKAIDKMGIDSDWEGWGTALKPAHEPICMARKPLSEKSIAENVLKHETGGINIDDCRIGSDTITTNGYGDKGFVAQEGYEPSTHEGRFPANIMFDEEAGKILGEPSRFFYCPKVSKKERNAGMDIEVGVFHQRPRREDGTIIYKETHPEEWKEAMNKLPRKDKTSKAAAEEKLQDKKGNVHPTVKPIKLMEYLITLVTPKGGIVLEPFMGSGSTGIAAKNLGMSFIGIEREEEYFKIAKRRIENYEL